MSTDQSGEGLKRVVGVTALAATVVNFTVGSSIYALPGLIAIHLGAASILGFFFCGLMFAAIVLCYVELGSRIKSSGGSYAYVEAAFGPMAGYVINWLFFFGWSVLSDAAVMNVLVDSLAILFPALADPAMRILLLVVFIGLMAVVNVFDTKLSVRLIGAIAFIKLIPLIAIILFGITHINAANLRIDHMPPLSAFNSAALILFFSLAGFESALNIGGEIKNPQRTVPRGILFGGLVTFFFYIAIQEVTIGVLGANVNEFKDAPLAAVADRMVGSAGGTILLIAAAITCFGTVLGDVLSGPRLLFAGARDGLFPKFLGAVHPKYSTPYWAVIAYALLIFVFATLGGFKQLAVLASGALLIIYLAVIAALIKLRMKQNVKEEKTFRVPGGLTIPMVAIAAIIYVLSNLSINEITSLAVFIAIICVIYFVMKRVQNQTQTKSVNIRK